MSGMIKRLSYLISRSIFRPARAFSVIDSFRPFIDVVILLILGALWVLLFESLFIWRAVHGGTLAFEGMHNTYIHILFGYVAAIALACVYATFVSISAFSLGVRPKFWATVLSFAVSTIVSLAVMTVPVVIIRIVEYGPFPATIAATTALILPWGYAVMLYSSAMNKLHRTTGFKLGVCLVLGALPLAILYVLLRDHWPAGYYIGLA